MRFLSILATAVIAAASCCNPNHKELTVVPYPNHVDIDCGLFNANGANINYDAAIDARSAALISSFAEQLSLVSGTQNRLVEATEGNGFLFLLNETLPAEAYTLNIDRRKAIVKASGLNGFNYAIQTIKQMLPVEIYGKAEAPGKEWTLLCCEIEDAPRFGYRGMHLDESRHFFGMDAVKRYLDIMEIHKLNTLHWHLTDDQGWRVEIKKYPRLTEVGSIRKKTVIGHIYKSKDYDHTPYGVGMWYSQDQIREIIEYAAAKGITIIPEIDLPGHMLAALAAYPELGCTGGPYSVWGDWGISDDVLCVGKEKTMQFLEDVLSEICDLFPSEYIHVGGDECPKVRWEKCPRCQAKIRELGLKANEEYQPEHFLQAYVISRMEKFINSKGKRIIGWDEILEGEVAPNATIMSWRGVGGGLEAVRLGHDAIMTPNTFFYLDYYQSLDKENEPLAIGGYLPIEKCYSFEPFTEDMTDEFNAIYDILGDNNGKHLFDAQGKISVNGEKGCVEVVLHAQGTTPVRYTLDGSTPTADSPLYTEPLEIRESCTLKAISESEGSRLYTKTFSWHKAMGRPVQMLTETHPRYTFSCPDMLTDGITGKGPYNSGDFAGWYNQPVDVIVDMGGAAYSEAGLSTYVYKYDYIFNPLDLVVSTSEDGENFTEVARVEYGLTGGIHEGNECQKFLASFPETTAKYLKITARVIDSLPEWHSGKGRPGFVFVDEILVN